MNRNHVLTIIKQHCVREYSLITDWVHDIEHIKTVVRNGRRLCRMEGLDKKTILLVELACWLHDLGRVGEKSGLEFMRSNHAQVSYERAKVILKPYEKYLGREAVIKVLQAVREHNKPSLDHPENVVGRLLVDADRGAGISLVGVFTMLNYLKITETKPIQTVEEARKEIQNLTERLVKEGKVLVALEKINYLRDWYYGSESQGIRGVRVVPLYTDSARELYKKSLLELEEYIEKLEALKQESKR